MTASLLADESSNHSWAHLPWPEFKALAPSETTAVLPVTGFADHGLNLPLDIEEVLGSALLKSAVSVFPAKRVLCLPPLRFGLAPYPHTFFGLDPDHAHAQLREIAASVQAAGVKRLVFFSTSPWNEEWIDAASRDIRQSLGLRTFVINLAGLGLDFHPSSPERRAAFFAASALLGKTPEPETREARVFDKDFRPGNFQQPAPLPPGPILDGPALLRHAVSTLRSLLLEVAAKPFPELPPASALAKQTSPTSEPAIVANPFPRRHRRRYLASLSAAEIAAVEDRHKAFVIIPTGAIEQHGHHLPVGVDALLGQAYLDKAFQYLSAEAPVWVGPAITFGKSNEHTGFPGTLTVSASSLRHTLSAVITGLHAFGFRNFAVLNTHGGNSAVLVYTLRELQTRLGGRLGMLNQLYKPELSPQESAYGFHAGDWETSLLLAIAPDLVQLDKAVKEYPARVEDAGLLRPENAPAIFSWITSDVSKSGVMGDAPSATAEKGAYWWDNYARSIAGRLEALLGT